jgi:uncharacterized protein
MPQLLFIHSAGPQSDTEGSGPLLAALREGLEPGITVVAPAMPGTDSPEAPRWDAAAADAVAPMTGPYALAGHSLGASTLLKYLAANDPPPGLTGVVLVSAPWWGTPNADADSFALPPKFERLSHLPRLLFITSRDDEIAPPSHAEKYVTAIAGAELKLLDGHGHEFSRGSNAPVVEALRGLF